MPSAAIADSRFGGTRIAAISHRSSRAAITSTVNSSNLDRPGRHLRKVHEPQFIGEVRLLASLPDEVEAKRAAVAVFATLQELLGRPPAVASAPFAISATCIP
jgi:hypothetical protein